MESIKQFIISGAVLLAIDAAYLTSMSTYFGKMIQNIQGTPMKFRLSGAVLCYLFLVFGLYHFILKEKKSLLDAFLFGLVIYGVYETTNYAIIEKWTPFAVLADTVWGGVLFFLTTFVLRTFFNEF